ncbi:MAG: tetratricopeptide repeat protein [Nitrospinae bacterium]|nr:tetratricopeptide repeat protein [Nitrospinota bacterium]
MWKKYLTRFKAWSLANKLAAIGIAVAIIAGIAVPFLIFSLSQKKEKDKATFQINANDNATIGSVTNIGEAKNVTILQSNDLENNPLIKHLKEREKELQTQLIEAEKTNAVKAEKNAALEKELADVRQRLANPKDTLEKYKKALDEASIKLSDFEKEFGKPRITAAKKSLEKGETEEAEKLFTEALEQGVKQAAESAYQLGVLAGQKMEYEKAFKYYNRAVELEKNNMKYLNRAGGMALTLGEYGKAEPLLHKALEIGEKVLQPEHQDIAASLNNLAALYHAQRRHAEAESLYKRALSIDEKTLGVEHPIVATDLNNLAALYEDQGRYSDAEPLYKRSISIVENALGAEHPNVAIRLNNLAAFYNDQERPVEAESLYERALSIDEKALGREHPNVAIRLNNLAGLYFKQGWYDKAVPLYKRAVAILEKILPDHPMTAYGLNNYADCLRKLNRIPEAEALEARAKGIMERHRKKNNPQ